ncbi:hypothetical protein [Sediminibacillus massiliensis]|uniref:hypothetical protein n=1 Tax=Sediminibacillus massiliensis TaxID=1926277 RepID=UPI000988783A|nr:hypothetical protein [Sediminibacillus massiliensis]
MSKRLKNSIISSLTFGVTAILFGSLIYGEIKWQTVIGLSLGGFLSWYFLIPKMNREKIEKKRN